MIKNTITQRASLPLLQLIIYREFLYTPADRLENTLYLHIPLQLLYQAMVIVCRL